MEVGGSRLIGPVRPEWSGQRWPGAGGRLRISESPPGEENDRQSVSPGIQTLRNVSADLQPLRCFGPTRLCVSPSPPLLSPNLRPVLPGRIHVVKLPRWSSVQNAQRCSGSCRVPAPNVLSARNYRRIHMDFSTRSRVRTAGARCRSLSAGSGNYPAGWKERRGE